MERIAIEPESYDYDRGINRRVLVVVCPNVSSFSFDAGWFVKFVVKDGSSSYEIHAGCYRAPKEWFKMQGDVSEHFSHRHYLS
ncbi:hypothetical protein ACFX2I_023331 [Malus domestica]